MIDTLDWVDRPVVRWPLTIALVVVFLLSAVSVLPTWAGAAALAIAVVLALYGRVNRRQRAD